ncbi:hypothetical protein Cni_G10916 [Canna indica]|uniref:RING-type E3 ubiquitin transferase n=1 Tax=Canna indica TaxID=4628 RepID=A0AAQ3K529_9LILI|nr:hypothetical protein Cni_G10916 [Canna indica]
MPCSSSVLPRPWLPIFLLFFSLFSISSSSPGAGDSYAENCNSTVPESGRTSLFVGSHVSFDIYNGYFSAGRGSKLFCYDRNPKSNVFSTPSFNFRTEYLHRTRTPGILQVDGTLVLRCGVSYLRNSSYDEGYHRNFTGVRVQAELHLSGFWSEATGDLCMVGHGIFYRPRGNPLPLSAVFKLNYPQTSDISTSLVKGTVKSLSASDSPNHFDPISLLAYAQKKYAFTKISEANSSCSSHQFGSKIVSIDPSSVCFYLQSMANGPFKLDYKRGCNGGTSCRTLASSFGFYTTFLSLDMVQCSDEGKLHLSVGFSNSSEYSYDRPVIPGKSLVAEGYWDHEKNLLCLIACHILEENSETRFSVGDCSIGLSLWLPAVMTLRNRSDIAGRVWSNKNKNDASYFSEVSLQSSRLSGQTFSVPGRQYEYTELDSVRKSCAAAVRGSTSSREKTYPNVDSFDDMRLYLLFRDHAGGRGRGSAELFSAGDHTFYGDGSYQFAVVPASSSSRVFEVNDVKSISIPAPNKVDLSNVSYTIKYGWRSTDSSKYEHINIAAEGIYNSGTGTLCLKGCRYPSSGRNSTDCEILINIQLPALNSKVEEFVNGSITSTRKKNDPLYFEPIRLSARHMYISQAAESIWWMDVETAMGLISLTFSCVCIALQIFHAKKHGGALPSISITMLAILVVGYLIPTVLNIDAVFVKKRRHLVFLQSGGWLEVDEVVARAMSLAALFLSFRLLQVAWSARSAEESERHRVAEMTTVKLCLPLYFAGALLTWFVAAWSARKSQLQSSEFDRHLPSWEELIPYAGLVLDGFLLPQVIFNLCRGSKERALTPFFYVGITATRALPHLYDAYRSHRFVPAINSSNIYAARHGDFYSSAWDVIVPCEGLVFAVVIFLQQRYGGGFCIPWRFRKFAEYEAVPVDLNGL